MVQRLGLAGHKRASYALLAQPVSKALHFVLESTAKSANSPGALKSEVQHPLKSTR